jgi:carbamoyl-phosphate synthase large subunit
VEEGPPNADEIEQKLAIPNSQRIFYLRHAFQAGMSDRRDLRLTGIDPWFLYQMKQIVEQLEQELAAQGAGLAEAGLNRQSEC